MSQSNLGTHSHPLGGAEVMTLASAPWPGGSIYSRNRLTGTRSAGDASCHHAGTSAAPALAPAQDQSCLWVLCPVLTPGTRVAARWPSLSTLQAVPWLGGRQVGHGCDSTARGAAQLLLFFSAPSARSTPHSGRRALPRSFSVTGRARGGFAIGDIRQAVPTLPSGQFAFLTRAGASG